MISYQRREVYSFVAFVIVSNWITTGIAQTDLNYDDHNEFCGIRPTLVAVNKPYFNFFPYYVTLHQCGGSIGHISPRIKLCVADKRHDVTVQVFNFNTKKIDNIVLKNHTSCKEQCKDSEEMCDPLYEKWNTDGCSCECKYGDTPPEPCPDRFKWNKYLCECECDRLPDAVQCQRQNKEWSNNQCGCVCPNRVVNRCKRKKKYLNEITCECQEPPKIGAQEGIKDENCVSMMMLFAIIIVEFVVLILLFDMCLCMTKGFGVLHFLRNAMCGSRKIDKDEPPLSPTSQTVTYL